MEESLTLTRNELFALTVAPDELRSLRDRLDLGEPTNGSCVHAGLSSLYARDLISFELGSVATPVSQVADSVGLCASAERGISVGLVVRDGKIGVSKLLSGPYGTVVASPIGFDCLSLVSVAPEVELASLVDRASREALRDRDAVIAIGEDFPTKRSIASLSRVDGVLQLIVGSGSVRTDWVDAWDGLRQAVR